MGGGYNNAEMELFEQCRNGKKWIVSQNPPKIV
jgi:hypothetical protein